MRQERVQFANTLRGIAAIAVLLSHYTFVFWTSRDAVASLIHAPALPDHFAFPGYLRWMHQAEPKFGFGPFGVALFFLISGFVIPFSLRNATWHGFLLARFFRIVPLYMAGFSVTLIAIWQIGRYFGLPWALSLRSIAIHYMPGLRDLFGVPSIDGIIWTLEIEIKFYLICALAMSWFRRSSLWVFAIPVALAAGEFYMIRSGFGVTALVPIPFLIFMFIGVAFHYSRAGALTAGAAVFWGTGLFAMFSILLGQAMPGLAPIAWAYGLAVAVFALGTKLPQALQSTPVTDFFADISYPLYVVHGVAGYAALRALLDLGFKAWVSLILVTLGAFGLSWILHVTVEDPCHRLGKRLAAAKLRAKVQPPAHTIDARAE